eukprot:TRINITY_DN89002_c0_g1_i1.p1 TRINITY_DN89002_c0_g1~~TRINITY_DN89002_c0_g1_i1.p1  ORF type:complete len:513 (-),score=69.98 TRINITY_DN89002_c0_g1_i1:98-1636(-)
MAAGAESSAVAQHRAEVKRCYQSARQVFKATDAQEIKLHRAYYSCLASTVLSELGEVAPMLRECLKSANGDEVTVPRSAMMSVMKAVAAWLATTVKADLCAAGSVRATADLQKCAEEAAVVHWQGRILVVGAGATGACTALRLRSRLGSGARLVVWEKARGAGGRMSTNRQDSIGVRADMGAPYLSLNGGDPNCSAVADMLLQSRVCASIPSDLLSRTTERPSGNGWIHLAGVEGGVNDALKKIFDKANAEVNYEHRLASLDDHHGQWRARLLSGKSEDFDAVILAVPGCGIGGDNLNKVHGGWERMISDEQNKRLLAVQHDQRWALALFFPMDCASKFDAFFGTRSLERVVDDSVVHLLCYQSRKTHYAGGQMSGSGLAIVAHTTVDWARKHSRANGRDQRLLDEITERVRTIVGLGRTRLIASKVITWKQSEVTKAISPGNPDRPYMLISSDPPMMLAGDYFTESNFGGCLKSAFATADALADNLSACYGKRRGRSNLEPDCHKRSKSGR